MTDGFSWKRAQKRNELRLPKRIAQMEKAGNGENVMILKRDLKRLKRRIELQKTEMDAKKIRIEVNKIA